MLKPNSSQFHFAHFLRRCSGALFLLCAGSLGALPASATPFIPSDDAQVLERLPTPGDAEQRALLCELRAAGVQVATIPLTAAEGMTVAQQSAQLGVGSSPRPYGALTDRRI